MSKKKSKPKPESNENNSEADSHQNEEGMPFGHDPSASDQACSQTKQKNQLSLMRNGSVNQKQQALREIYEKYHPDVRRFIQSKKRRNSRLSDEDVDDIFAETWKVAVEKLPGFEWREEASPNAEDRIKSWLMTTANNKYREYVRAAIKAGDPISFEDEILTSEESEADIDESLLKSIPQFNGRLQEALTQLSIEEQEIIRLKFERDKNSTAIGKVLGLSPGTVRGKARRAVIKLQKILQTNEA